MGVILASVSMGIGQWARFDTDRVDNSIKDGATFKTLGLLSRCVSYDLTKAIVEQGTGEPQVRLGRNEVVEVLGGFGA